MPVNATTIFAAFVISFALTGCIVAIADLRWAFALHREAKQVAARRRLEAAMARSHEKDSSADHALVQRERRAH